MLKLNNNDRKEKILNKCVQLHYGSLKIVTEKMRTNLRVQIKSHDVVCICHTPSGAPSDVVQFQMINQITEQKKTHHLIEIGKKSSHKERRGKK